MVFLPIFGCSGGAIEFLKRYFLKTLIKEVIMMTINESVKTAISRFLSQQIDAKTEKISKQLISAQKNGDDKEATKLQTEIQEIKQKFNQDTWLNLAANTMAKQLKFGTHISKGVHPFAKGDNVNFVPRQPLVQTLIGTHSIDKPALDANGNAAALPLASFFDFDVTDGVKVRDLILSDNADFIASLSCDKDVANFYHAKFKQALENKLINPATEERNKQLLWALNDTTVDCVHALEYVNIIPLHPSALSYEIYQKINRLRYSDENKKALENRFKLGADHTPYLSMPNMAILNLGGSKPQNISQLTVRQGGRNYLLPSLPPKIQKRQMFTLSKFTENFFHSEQLKYYVEDDFEFIAQVVQDTKNNIHVRDKRKDAIDRILHTIFGIAHYLQNQPAGWSRDYHLSLEQKIWLDPYRADLEGEEEFLLCKTKNDWQKEILNDFASWLNDKLRKRFQDLKFDFADSEHKEWKREIEEMQDFYQRAGKGVFL